MDGGSGNVVVVTGRGYMNKRKETEIPFQKCFHHRSRNFLMQAETVLPSTQRDRANIRKCRITSFRV